MDLAHLRFRGMPAAGRDGVCRAGAAATAKRERQFTTPAFPAMVLERAGLDPRCYREVPLMRRTAACVRALRAPSVGAAADRLAADPSLTAPALNSLLVGASAFFRDAPVFAAMAKVITSGFVARGRALRVASVGCSSGAELYSVAILLAEAGLLADAELLGIDCRDDAVTAARAGIFSAATLADVDERLRGHYFIASDNGWRVGQVLRDHTQWRALDATRTFPEGPWDIVLCRNLLIYLQPQVGAAMLTRMTAQLAPRGLVVVGKAERPPAALPLRSLARCIYQAHD
jgi:chemotaxis methyl-accepting protein methylase